jgi:hypothetical protein
MSTLPPTPVVDPNIPIVTPNGGSSAAYNDPNSPESIMKKTHTMNVQSKTDSKYDVAVSPYVESFVDQSPSLLWVFLLLCIVGLYGITKAKGKGKPITAIPLYAGIAIVLILAIYQKTWMSRND